MHVYIYNCIYIHEHIVKYLARGSSILCTSMKGPCSEIPVVSKVLSVKRNRRRPLLTKLDDGWPESVEERGLLLLVLRHYITRQYIKDVL